VNNIV